jgi:hypothetical protein
LTAAHCGDDSELNIAAAHSRDDLRAFGAEWFLNDGVDFEEACLERLVLGVARLDAESDLKHAARAARSNRACRRDGHLGPATLHEERVERAREVRRGVGKGPVEIEQDRADVHPGLIAWTM